MNARAALRQTTVHRHSDQARTTDLRALLAGVAGVPPEIVRTIPADIAIGDLTLDSRSVVPGAAFVALPGLRTHGIGFAMQAANAGAAAILWEPVPGLAAPALPSNVALVAVPDLSRHIGEIAARFFAEPSRALSIAGVTGTNGKTTTAWLIAAALERLGRPAAYAGTLGVGRLPALRAAAYTTPDCITVHRQLAELRNEGVRSLGMEVSSHALDQRRVAGVHFDTAVFTNLTRDHLDYHGSFAAYGAAKAQLFEFPDLRHAVINTDDAFGRQLACGRTWEAALTLYGRARPVPHASPDTRYLFAGAIAPRPQGLEIAIDGDWGTATLRSRFVGDFNAENLLAVLAVLLGWEVPLADAVNALEHCVAPPGRMETFSAPGKPLAVVDYAHTPDALEKALQAVRGHCKGRITCVFGCGGERDPGKRPLMGAVAERLADRVIVTDDNPRGEDGDSIVAGILQGIAAPERVRVERDRAAAIEQALAAATSGDIVLVAGKGHEDYQIVSAERRYFSDRDVVQAALRLPASDPQKSDPQQPSAQPPSAADSEEGES